jgi:hypothetical protein
MFAAAMTCHRGYVAFRGLRSWRWIGVGWLVHTAWDVFHYLHGKPILPFAAHSSLGCAICDPVIALWCFAGGPFVPDALRRWSNDRIPATRLLPGALRRHQADHR